MGTSKDMIYVLRSIRPGGRLVGALRFSALDDAEALSIAAEMVKASAVVGYDVWQGQRRVEAEEKKPRRGTAGLS